MKVLDMKAIMKPKGFGWIVGVSDESNWESSYYGTNKLGIGE